MQKRIRLLKDYPEAYKAISALQQFLNNSSLTPIEKGLIEVRASQINGCAFCINMHTKAARAHGETEQRLYLLNGWREAGDIYTESERAMLALTEEITLIAKGGVSDSTYATAEKILGPSKLSEVIMAVITINSWNRAVISTNTPVEKD